jgi:YidC/Oxa1 family membrane protein insertase
VDRKLLAWLLICVSMFLLFNSMQRNRELAQIEQEKKAKLADEQKQKKASEAKTRAENVAKSDPSFVLPVDLPRQRFTLGSMDPADKYPFLVTLDNRGAAIERIELVGQSKAGKYDYRSLRTKENEGYLGYLALEETQGALLVNSVPKGSAAADAKCKEDSSLIGLKPGDKIVGWDGGSGMPTLYKLEKRLEKQGPGKKIELSIERAGHATPFTFDCTLTERPLDILRSEDDFNAEQVNGNYPIPSCTTTIAAINDTSIEEGDRTILGLEKTTNGVWSAKEMEIDGGSGIEFTMPLKDHLRLAGVNANLELVKQYRLKQLPSKSGREESSATSRTHHIELTTLVRNLDDKPHSVALRQDGLNGVSLEGWWYPTKISPYFFNAAGARDVIVGDAFKSHSLVTTRQIVANAASFTADPDLLLFGPAENLTKRNVNYIGLDTQSFTAAMLPGAGEPDSMSNLQRAKATVFNSVYTDLNKLPSSKQQAANIGFWFETDKKSIQPNEEWKLEYQVFAGPKDPQLLSAYKLDEALEYGWHIFGFFAKRLGWILHSFFWLTGNFAIAIMMLTVLVRSCMFPVSRKMALNASKMQSVQPHMAKLKENLKEDPRKMMAAQQMLMKKAGINQFAGCLPAIIQLPIVIGLYRCVSVDVGLRQQSLIPGWEWCSNLAGPDMFMDWHSWMPDFIAGRGSGWFGPYLNILPIITITLFIIQQKVLMPKATDEQTRVAQQMMMAMTVMMGVLFFKVPAGLCIYFITSSTWSLVERFLIKRFTPKSTNVELPENTATEIIAALNKGGAATARLGASVPAAFDDKPKPKAPKAPETLQELWDNLFKKKPDSTAPKTDGPRKGPPLPQRKSKKSRK